MTDPVGGSKTACARCGGKGYIEYEVAGFTEARGCGDCIMSHPAITALSKNEHPVVNL